VAHTDVGPSIYKMWWVAEEPDMWNCDGVGSTDGGVLQAHGNT
jgi:hypothetical protein